MIAWLREQKDEIIDQLSRGETVQQLQNPDGTARSVVGLGIDQGVKAQLRGYVDTRTRTLMLLDSTQVSTDKSSFTTVGDVFERRQDSEHLEDLTLMAHLYLKFHQIDTRPDSN